MTGHWPYALRHLSVRTNADISGPVSRTPGRNPPRASLRATSIHRRYCLALLALAFAPFLASCGSSNTGWYDEASDPASGRHAYSDSAVSLIGSKPNIVFILADDLGYYDAFRQDPFYETPHLDQLAAGGLVFEHAYSSGPNCAPSRASLMTGTTTPRHQIYTPNAGSKIPVHNAPLWVPMNKRSFANSGVSPEEYKYQYNREGLTLFDSTDALDDLISIADILAQAGYRTARLGKWHLGPNNLGFDISSSDGRDREKGGDSDRKSHYSNPDVARTLTDAAVTFIEQTADQPFFLYVSHWDPHFPEVADAAVIEKYEAKKQAAGDTFAHYNPTYAAMVEAIDTSTGRILAALEKAGIDDNTLVIFASDNGGTAKTRQHELRSIKGSLYEGGIKVSAAARWPAVLKAGSNSPTVISSVDFLPTFTELAGVSLDQLRKPQRQVLDGRSLVPVLAGDEVAPVPAFFHFPLYLGTNRRHDGPAPGFHAMPSSAVILGRWKLIEYFVLGADGKEAEVTSRFELYNLTDDPGESRNLVATTGATTTESKKVFEELKGLLLDWRSRTAAPVPTHRNKFFMPRSGTDK